MLCALLRLVFNILRGKAGVAHSLQCVGKASNKKERSDSLDDFFSLASIVFLANNRLLKWVCHDTCITYRSVNAATYTHAVEHFNADFLLNAAPVR